jgi:phosphoesterase RecJ-like protein
MGLAHPLNPEPVLLHLVNSFHGASALLARVKRPLLLSHAKPDGDAIGSLIAMRSFLRAMGGDPTIVIFDGVPYRYDFLERNGKLPVFGKDRFQDRLSDFDAVVIVDTCAGNQVEPLAAWIQQTSIPKLVVDHHVTRDLQADCYVIDEHAAATCLILHEWARAQQWPLDAEAAEALFVGIATDTGWFRHSNTDARALTAAADLATRGVRVHELAQRLYQQDSAARLRLHSAALNTLELLADNRLAVMTVSSAAITAADAKLSDTEDIVNEPLRIATVVVSILLVEQEPDLIRVNFRSKAPLSAVDHDIDVAALAATFGGGGHRRAAGARVKSSLEAARQRVVEQAQGSVVP